MSKTDEELQRRVMEWQEALERKAIKDRGGVTEKSDGMAGSIREEGYQRQRRSYREEWWNGRKH